MDSKQLFRFFQSKYYLTNWLNEEGKLAQNEGKVKWLYCGLNEDFRYEVVSQVINNTFTDDEVYLCISSNKSSLVLKSIAVNEIGNILHKKEIGVMDKSFTKIIYFTRYGVFKSGIIREFPKSRSRPDGKHLKVSFYANRIDENTKHVSSILYNPFYNFEMEFQKDYGGFLEHLWIVLELDEISLSRRGVYPFRFQKRVDNPASYTEFYSYNVAHYSIKPDFEKLRGLVSEESICSYAFGLLYESTKILVDKQKKLDGFNAIAFRLDFLSICKKLGYYTE